MDANIVALKAFIRAGMISSFQPGGVYPMTFTALETASTQKKICLSLKKVQNIPIGNPRTFLSYFHDFWNFRKSFEFARSHNAPIKIIVGGNDGHQYYWIEIFKNLCDKFSVSLIVIPEECD